mgnify:CR=1 FL=1
MRAPAPRSTVPPQPEPELAGPFPPDLHDVRHLWLKAGLLGVFVSALLSATVLPGSTEIVLTAKIVAYPALTWFAFAAALLGSGIGCALNFGMGQAARGGRMLRGERGVLGDFMGGGTELALA